MKKLILQTSSASHRNTHKLAQLLMAEREFDLIDLSTKNIGHFDYDFNNKNDDFLPLICKIIAEYELIIFLTPVYWYSMSGIAKVFLDRISDLLKIEKETGRKLRGKWMGAMACGSDSDEIEGFFVPFRLSADYLGMHYIGDAHAWVEDDQEPEPEVKAIVKTFTQKIIAAERAFIANGKSTGTRF